MNRVRCLHVLALLALASVLAVSHPPVIRVVADNGITSLNVHTYQDSIGTGHVVGEVRNDTGQTVQYLDIIASYLDSTGSFLATADAYSMLDILNPGDISPFDVSLSNLPAAVAQYNLQMQWQPTTKQPVTDLTIIGDRASRDSIGFTHVAGQVRNDSGSALRFVQIIATFYQSDGAVADADYTYSKLDTINPGQTSPFDLLGGTRTYVRYRLQAQGQLP